MFIDATTKVIIGTFQLFHNIKCNYNFQNNACCCVINSNVITGKLWWYKWSKMLWNISYCNIISFRVHHVLFLQFATTIFFFSEHHVKRTWNDPQLLNVSDSFIISWLPEAFKNLRMQTHRPEDTTCGKETSRDWKITEKSAQPTVCLETVSVFVLQFSQDGKNRDKHCHRWSDSTSKTNPHRVPFSATSLQRFSFFLTLQIQLMKVLLMSRV